MLAEPLQLAGTAVCIRWVCVQAMIRLRVGADLIGVKGYGQVLPGACYSPRGTESTDRSWCRRRGGVDVGPRGARSRVGPRAEAPAQNQLRFWPCDYDQSAAADSSNRGRLRTAELGRLDCRGATERTRSGRGGRALEINSCL